MYKVTAPRSASNHAARSCRRTIAVADSIAAARMLLWMVKKLKKFAALNSGRSSIDANW